jgi:glyoxylase-like metal-dependent hydrolase (beta-lactamase superfamily II)
MEPFKVTEGVYQVGGPDMTAPEDCCVYLVDLGAPMLIDAGSGTNTKGLLANLEKVGCPPARLKALVLTHAHIDHVGGASWFVEKHKTPVYMHELDAPVMEQGDNVRSAATAYRMDLKPLRVRHLLKGEGGVLGDGFSPLHWVHTPGHTPGSISLWAEAGLSRVLFGQDVHGPFYDIFGSDLDAWADSMRALLELEADILCEGHFGIYRPASEVRLYIENYLHNYGKA